MRVTCARPVVVRPMESGEELLRRRCKAQVLCPAVLLGGLSHDESRAHEVIDQSTRGGWGPVDRGGDLADRRAVLARDAVHRDELRERQVSLLKPAKRTDEDIGREWRVAVVIHSNAV